MNTVKTLKFIVRTCIFSRTVISTNLGYFGSYNYFNRLLFPEGKEHVVAKSISRGIQLFRVIKSA